MHVYITLTWIKRPLSQSTRGTQSVKISNFEKGQRLCSTLNNITVVNINIVSLKIKLNHQTNLRIKPKISVSLVNDILTFLHCVLLCNIVEINIRGFLHFESFSVEINLRKR